MANNNAKLIEFNATAAEVADMNDTAEMAQEMLKTVNNINITRKEAIPTISYTHIEAIVKKLDKIKSKDKDVSVNFMNLFEIGITYRPSEDGEKEGNYVPFIRPLSILKTMIKSDEDTEDND